MAWGQTTVTIGSGTNTGSKLPVSPFFTYSYSQQIILQSEIAQTGTITKIKFYMVGGVSLNYSNNWTIYLGHTTKTAFSSNTDWVGSAALTQVYSGNITSTPAAGWYEIVLSTSFNYNNTDNLVIAVDENASSYNGSANYARIFTPSGAATYRSIYYENDGTNPNPASPPTATTRQTYLNQVQLVFETATTVPNCATAVSPSNSATGIQPSASLNWASGGGLPTGYKLYFGTDNPPTNIANGTDLGLVTTYDPTPDLSYSTNYYWKVVPYNAFGDATGCSVWSFTTMADPTITSFPFTESFDGATFPPSNWVTQKTAGNGTGLWDRQTTGTSPTCTTHSGAGMTRYNSLSYASGTKGILMTPPVQFNSDAYRVKFWLFRDDINFSADLVNVYYNTTNSLTGATLLGTVNRSISYSPNVATKGWYEYTYNMPSGSTGTGRYIIFEGVSAYGNNIFIDDVTIEAIPATPTFLVTPTSKDFGTTISGNSSTTQNFTVTNPDGGTLTFTQGNISLTGANADQFTLVDANTYPINLTNGQSCTVGVKFTPNSAGAKTANLQFIHNSSGSPSTVSLTGNALAAGSLFESFEGTWLPTGWSADASSWTQSSAGNGYDGTKSAYLYTTSTITDKKLITPKVTVTGSSQLSYYAKTASGSSQKIQVKYSTDKTNWTNIGSQITLTSTFTQYTVDLSSLAGQNVYLAFSASTTSSYVYFYVDYVMGPVITQEAPAAATIGAPANSATGILPTSTLTWSAGATGGTPTGYKLYFGTDNPPTNIANNTDLGLVTSYDPNPDMALNTTYYWQIVPYNSLGNAASCPVWSFTTVPDPTITTLPHTQNFDGATSPALPYGWNTVVTSSNSYAVVNNSTLNTPQSSPNHAYMYNSGDNSATLILVSPQITPDLNTLKLKFYGKSSSAGTVSIGTMNSQTGTYTEFTTVSLTTSYAQYTVDFSAYAGSNHYIAFKHTNGVTYRSINIDNFYLETLPVTPVFSVSPTSKDFGTVISGSTSAAQTFTISNTGVGTLTINAGGITLTGANTNQFSLTDNNTYPINLTAGQSATVSVAFAPTSTGAKTASLQVTHNASGSPSTIALSGTAYDCSAQTIPYSENFDGVTAPAIPLCMTVTNNNNDDKLWATNAATYKSAPNAMMIGYNSNLAMNDWFFSQPLSLQAGHLYTLRFYYRAQTATFTEKLEVKWGTSPDASNMTSGSLFDNNNISAVTWQLAEASFTPATTGTYYIGWHGYSDKDKHNLLVDDIAITETPTATTWNGTTNNDWATATNWSNGLPGSITDVTIPAGLTNYPTVASASTIKSLVMGDGATLLGFKLLTITNGATLTRNISGKDDYHLISSPVQSITAGQAFPSNQNHIWVRSYDEPTGNWNNLEATSALTPGIGYSFFMDIASTSAVFNGQFNVGNGTYISPALTLSGTVAGYGRYNLLGNPYPATLDWDLGLWTKTGLEASVWVWSDPIGAYVSWNGSAGSLSNGVIPVAQGFFVKGTDLAFSASIRIPIDATRHNQQGFYKEAPQKVLRLDVTNSVNPYQNSLFVQYTENATAGFDDQFDTRKMSDLAETPELWAMAGETRVSIDALPSIEQNNEVDVWFKPGVDAQYTLTASGMETFANGDVAYLIDNLTGYKQNINQNPVYTFSAQAAPASSRFKISFSGVGIENPTTTSMGAYSYNGRIIVQLNDATTGVLNITNMAGQKMTSQSFSNLNEITTNGTYRPGIYLVSVTTATGTITRKVVVL